MRASGRCWLLLLACAWGCSSDEALSLEAFEHRARVAVCRQLFDCPADDVESVAARLALLDVESCAAITSIQPSFGRYADAARAGLLRYDGHAAARCVRWLESSCIFDALFEGHARPPACFAMFEGTLAPGAPCDRRPDACQPGSYCETGGARCGVCTPQLPPGAACGNDRQCLDVEREDDEVAVCVGSGFFEQGVCGRGLLLPSVAEHGACGNVGTRADGATLYAFCRLGYRCPEFDRTSYCRAPVPTGAACGADTLDTCGGRDACVLPSFGTIGSCVAVQLSSREGERCEGETALACDERAGLACSDGGDCVRVGDGTEGSPCAVLWSRPACGDGLLCLDGVCSRPRAQGDPCSFDSDCASDACDHPSEVCTDPRPSCLGGP